MASNTGHVKTAERPVLDATTHTVANTNLEDTPLDSTCVS